MAFYREAVTIADCSLRSTPFLSEWDFRFIRRAQEISSWSKDPKRKVGCVLVRGKREVCEGFNGFPEGLSDELKRLTDPDYKGKVIIHAEANAIIDATRRGVTLEGTTAYVTFHPCSLCASMLIQAGVKKIICPPPVSQVSKWSDNFKTSSDLLLEVGVPVYYFSETDESRHLN